MANIFEISEETGISLAKLRRMDKKGFLRLDTVENEVVTQLRHYLARNQQMSVKQLMWLIENPSAIIDLGGKAPRARAQLAALGDIEPAPSTVTAYIGDAARKDAEAVEILSQWLREVLPAKPVSHAWISVRLLLGTPVGGNLRASNISLIPLALMNVRRQASFAGWFEIVPAGETRTTTFYSRPKNLLDL